MKTRKFHRFVSRFIFALLSLFITMFIIVGLLYVYMELQLPNVAVLRDVHMQIPLRIYTREGKLIAEYGSERRRPVTLDQVPEPLVQAILAVEDARFYDHPGVDLIGLVRATRAVLASGRKVQGASTITMQVARNFFLTRKKTYSRKIKEILLALKIDKEFSKNKILELYLNKVYFGNRAYGVSAAAQVYYGKKLNQLSLAQMAMLAGLPQAPSRNNPLRSPQRALKRRNHVLKRMLDVGFIDQKQYQKAIKQPIMARYHGQKVSVSAPYVAEMVRQQMVREYGRSAYDRGLSVTTTLSAYLQQQANEALKKGLLVYSERHGYRKSEQNLGWPSDDNRLQWEEILQKMGVVGRLQPAVVLATNYQTAAALLADGGEITLPWSGLSWARPAYREGFVGSLPQRASDVLTPGDVIWVMETPTGWRLTQVPMLQGALVSLNPQNGAILALVGGFNYKLSNFNRATRARRQPGSSFKPFIYSAALEKGFTLASIINDAPVVVRDSGENRLWRPNNDTLRFYGPTRLREGLIHSRNLVSIRLLRAVGIPFAVNYVQRFGFQQQQLPKSLSLALGTGLVTPEQMAAAYAIFANGGYRVTPYFIREITDDNTHELRFAANPARACEACIQSPLGDLAFSSPTAPLARRVITPQNAYLITRALQGAIQHGTGRAARVLARQDLAGKTGTTNNKIDAWFSGYNSDLATTIWVGFDNAVSMHEYGAQAALPIWIDYMRGALSDMPEHGMPEPPDIVTVRIDPHSGLLASPNQHNAIFEVFRKERQPTNFSNSAGGSSTTAGGDGDEPLF